MLLDDTKVELQIGLFLSIALDFTIYVVVLRAIIINFGEGYLKQ
jgi:hypothetical protein